MEMSEPRIFVFTDDLSVHRSLAGAAGYHEYRDTLQAYDSTGQLFEISPCPGDPPVLQPGNRRKELVRKLRLKLVSLAISRPDLLRMGKWEVKHAPDDQIVAMAVRWFSIRDPSPRENAVAWAITIVVSPILVVLWFVALMIVGVGLLVDGARRAWDGERPPD